MDTIGTLFDAHLELIGDVSISPYLTTTKPQENVTFICITSEISTKTLRLYRKTMLRSFKSWSNKIEGSVVLGDDLRPA